MGTYVEKDAEFGTAGAKGGGEGGDLWMRRMKSAGSESRGCRGVEG